MMFCLQVHLIDVVGLDMSFTVPGAVILCVMYKCLYVHQNMIDYYLHTPFILKLHIKDISY